MVSQLDPELLSDYKKRVVPALREKHGYANLHEIPKIRKVVVNSSIGAGTDAKEALEIAKAEIGPITSKRPVPTLAKKSTTHCTRRKGQAIGAKVTPRGRMMYEFLERLI